MTGKLIEELYSEYVVLLRQLNKKQGKLIEKLSEELTAAKDDVARLNRMLNESQAILGKTRTDMIEQNRVIQELAQEKLALKKQITEESTAHLYKVKAEMAEQNERIQELARENLERGKQIVALKNELALVEALGPP